MNTRSSNHIVVSAGLSPSFEQSSQGAAAPRSHNNGGPKKKKKKMKFEINHEKRKGKRKSEERRP